MSKARHFLTGLNCLDKRTLGLHPGELVCIASRPGMGKTSLAISMTANVVLSRKPTPTLLCSLEMNAQNVMNRLVASEGSVNLADLHKGAFDKAGWDNIVATLARLEEAPLYIYDKPAPTLQDITAEARRLSAKLRAEGRRLGLVVIDYLQLIKLSRARRTSETGKKLIRELKALAKELHVSIVVLSQVRRPAGGCPKGRAPRMTDLPDADALDFYSDLVAFIHRQHKPGQTASTEEAELILAKNRHGRTGCVHLDFLQEYGRFQDAN
ncbi:MAG: DnaB-like helicase C-terminal domain-containing protein [Elusimicrobiota bacterium]|jgi:replicative DNA helicase